MKFLSWLTLLSSTIAWLGAYSLAHAADEDALDLQVQATPTPTTGEQSPIRLSVEAGFGRLHLGDGLSTQATQRFSIDFRYATVVSKEWRLAFSSRLDAVHPAAIQRASTLNSVREASVGWQREGGLTTFDLGRINQRQAPAYGFSPTDYFKYRALRAVTTADPAALRENRMGTAMLRVGQQWGRGEVSLALVPKLANTSSDGSFALDLGATNSTDKMLMAANTKHSDSLSTQVSWLAERGSGSKIGASVNALASSAAVVYGELSFGSMRSLAGLAGVAADDRRRNSQAAFGITYTLMSNLSVTVESEYSGTGLNRDELQKVLAQAPAISQRFLALNLSSQELVSRRAWLVYAVQKGLVIKQLDLSMLVRQNAVDHSSFAWIELRHHWGQLDTALQWQRGLGGSLTEYGSLPYRQAFQILGAWYF